MKFSPAFVLAFAAYAAANPLAHKRATTSDAATIGYAAGTTGGGSATVVTVTTLAELKNAASSNTAKVILVSGNITGNEVVKVGSNTSILGKSGASLTGVGLRVNAVSNVIIRNLKISKVLAEAGDHIAIQASNRIWVDSVELSSDKDHDKDYYDGLLDITHGCYAVSVTNTYLHDHYKASLVGHSDSVESEDKAIQVTYTFNKWENLNSRTPSSRSGHGHIYNNYNNDGINTRFGAELLVENNVFENVGKPLYSTDSGFANASDNDFGGAERTAETTTWKSVGYDYSLTATSSVKASVEANAGAKLSF
ncbi:hypothetical protein FRC11_010938 [Ceratobasidium sp. 423]|nr:hypothetical protein FRC11_010938 [Ceratobasidium sp. 423]